MNYIDLLYYLPKEGWIDANNSDVATRISAGAIIVKIGDGEEYASLRVDVYDSLELTAEKAARRFGVYELDAAKLWAELVFHGGAT